MSRRRRDARLKRLAWCLIGAVAWVLVSGQSLVPERPYKGRTLSEWQQPLRDPNPAVRAEAVEAMGHFGARAVPTLIQALEDRDWLVQHRALQVLRQLAPMETTAVAALSQALRSRDWAVRHGATQELGELVPGAAPAVPALIEALKDPDWLVRLGAIQALGQLGSVAAPAVSALIHARTDSDRVVQEAAIKALRDLAGKDPALRNTVQRALEGKPAR